MKWCVIIGFALLSAFLFADLLLSRSARPLSGPSVTVPFKHSLHADSIGLDCAACHTGAFAMGKAFMPTKADCMDCHRLPLTERKEIEELDSALSKAPEQPWARLSELPEHVVFHHGVHRAAGVSCADCHGNGYSKDVYGGESFDMKTCLSCHRGESFKEKNFRAAVYCAACHR